MGSSNLNWWHTLHKWVIFHSQFTRRNRFELMSRMAIKLWIRWRQGEHCHEHFWESLWGSVDFSVCMCVSEWGCQYVWVYVDGSVRVWMGVCADMSRWTCLCVWKVWRNIIQAGMKDFRDITDFHDSSCTAILLYYQRILICGTNTTALSVYTNMFCKYCSTFSIY